MAITATGMSAPQRVMALPAANQYSAAPTFINQNPLQPQVQPTAPIANYQTQPMQNLPAYGLAGSEQALNQWYGTAIGGMQNGIEQARNAMMGQFNAGLSGYNDALTGARNDLLVQSDLGRNRLNNALSQAQGFNQQAIGAIDSAGASANSAIKSGISGVKGAFDEGVSALNQFLPQGVNAYNQLGDYLGLGGTAAQAQAMQSYTESPAMQYQREKTMRAVMQNARALGGVGGNAQLELARELSGLQTQDYNNYLDRLSGVANTGFGAAQGVGSLRGQQAGITGNLAAQQAQNALQQGQLKSNVYGQMGSDALNVGQAILGERQNLGAALSGISAQGGANTFGARQNLGSNIGNLLAGGAGAMADYAMNTGTNIASGRQQAGRDISAIQQAQGQNYANMLGSNASNIAQILSGVGDTINSQQGNLASLIANLATNTANTAGNQTSVAQFMRSPDYVNQLSQVLAATGAGYQYGR